MKLSFKKKEKKLYYINVNGEEVGCVQQHSGNENKWFWYLSYQNVPRVNTSGNPVSLEQAKNDIKSYLKQHLEK